VIKIVLTAHQMAEACIEYAKKRSLAPVGTYNVSIVFTTEGGEPRATLEMEEK
jgi:hypothetical protein